MDKAYQTGVRCGLPIGLGYLSVSFAFGMMAASGGLGVVTPLLISLTNLTSAGQFAGTKLMLAGVGWVELALTMLVINFRYSMMSVSLSQKIAPDMPSWKRAIMAFGVTDETFVLGMLQQGDLTFPFWLGLITLPYCGWAAGTLFGASMASVLPALVRECLGIALYAMFIALLFPAARGSLAVTIAILLSAVLSTLLFVVQMSPGFAVMIASIAAAAVCAWRFPVSEGAQ